LSERGRQGYAAKIEIISTCSKRQQGSEEGQNQSFWPGCHGWLAQGSPSIRLCKGLVKDKFESGQCPEPNLDAWLAELKAEFGGES
jgi:hypothetical protein